MPEFNLAKVCSLNHEAVAAHEAENTHTDLKLGMAVVGVLDEDFGVNNVAFSNFKRPDSSNANQVRSNVLHAFAAAFAELNVAEFENRGAVGFEVKQALNKFLRVHKDILVGHLSELRVEFWVQVTDVCGSHNDEFLF